MPKHNLIIIESPSKAPAIKNYLGSNYKVVWSKGHVRDLPKSTLGVDIENDFEPHYINIRGCGPLIKELRKEVKNANKIFLATDPDREGEAIAWHLSTALNLPEERTHRIIFNEITKSAVKAGVKNPRKIDMNLVSSQQTRRILDRIVGYKLSPFLWKTVRSGLSAGRVQSVATRLIVEREAEINAFVPAEYWSIAAQLKNEADEMLTVKFYGNADGKMELANEADTMAVVHTVTGKPFRVESVKKSVRMRNPAPPFTTSTMQQDASRKLGFQSQRIMRVAQELYEGISVGSENGGVQGLITYMRTDSLRVSAEAVEASAGYIKEKYGDDYYPEVPRVYKTKANAQDAHEAIRPSNFNLPPEKIKKSLTTDQYKLYKLIWDRFVASQMASAALDVVSATFECEGYRFKASGYTVRFPGFMAVYGDVEDTSAKGTDSEDAPERTKLPELAEGTMMQMDAINPQQHFTEPPPRYTEGSLVKMFEEIGVARPSTYATTISTIVSRGYVTREGKTLRPTQLGEITTKIMCEHFPKIIDYEFTADIEDNLDEIENGENDMLSVLREFYADFDAELKEAAEAIPEGSMEIGDEETDIVCEKCGSKMVIKNGRFGKFAACPNYPQCKNTKPIGKDGSVEAVEVKPAPEGMKCEKCGADMVIRTGRYGSFYACSKYPECKFTKQIATEIGVPCPLCGSKLLLKRGKGRVTVFYSCEKYPECGFSSWDLPLNETCPDCGKMLFKKKGKNLIVCADKECGYKREIEENEESADDAE
ncbi:MAG: type I DNA topoisomerase [Clostridia bacterium]|nr:type I DNA topoisomerase [Clostridia bacterium]